MHIPRRSQEGLLKHTKRVVPSPVRSLYLIEKMVKRKIFELLSRRHCCAEFSFAQLDLHFNASA
jgi:hypothetical protein